MLTVQELAGRVLEARKTAWSRQDSQTAILATEQLNPDDEQVVRRIVSEAGFQGDELEKMVKQVSARVVGHVEAMADNMPAAGGD